MTRFASPLAILGLVACGSPSFSTSGSVERVRILAISADTPYARPGATVTLEMLAFDGRTNPTTPMRLSWLPAICPNPAYDSYASCYPYFAAAFTKGQDLSPMLYEGTTFSFEMPSTILDEHNGAYGSAIAFAFACAGHVEYDPPSNSADRYAIPFGCFDDQGVRLGSEDFVFAFARVYAFADRTNENPVLSQVTWDGAAVDPSVGVTVSPCTGPKDPGCRGYDFDVVVPSTSQEVDPGSAGVFGPGDKEQIWVDYYATMGALKASTFILYEPSSGRLSKTGNTFTPPSTTGDGWLWAVVHDNRGGVTWQAIPIHVL